MDHEEPQRVKHIDVKYFVIRNHEELGTLKMIKVHLKISSRIFISSPFQRKGFMSTTDYRNPRGCRKKGEGIILPNNWQVISIVHFYSNS